MEIKNTLLKPYTKEQKEELKGQTMIFDYEGSTSIGL